MTRRRSDRYDRDDAFRVPHSKLLKPWTDGAEGGENTFVIGETRVRAAPSSTPDWTQSQPLHFNPTQDHSVGLSHVTKDFQ